MTGTSPRASLRRLAVRVTDHPGSQPRPLAGLGLPVVPGRLSRRRTIPLGQGVRYGRTDARVRCPVDPGARRGGVFRPNVAPRGSRTAGPTRKRGARRSGGQHAGRPGVSRELDATLDDISAVACLGRYYAAKTRGATALHRYETGDDEAEKERAVYCLEAAASHWENYCRSPAATTGRNFWPEPSG